MDCELGPRNLGCWELGTGGLGSVGTLLMEPYDAVPSGFLKEIYIFEFGMRIHLLDG